MLRAAAAFSLLLAACAAPPAPAAPAAPPACSTPIASRIDVERCVWRREGACRWSCPP